MNANNLAETVISLIMSTNRSDNEALIAATQCTRFLYV